MRRKGIEYEKPLVSAMIARFQCRSGGVAFNDANEPQTLVNNKEE